MTTETATDAARSELLEAIGLSQAQFASAEGDGLDSAALIAAVDAFEEFIRSEAVDVPSGDSAGDFARWLSGAAAGDLVPGWEESWTKSIERRDAAIRAESDDLLAAAEQAREAFRLTREYVGEDTLPAIEGWSWYDADKALKAAIGIGTPEVTPS